jgi:protein tyrosine phosphatase
LLPDRFPDRTTRHSEARENLYKNRYPDIKAYDQTRVRLSQVDSVVGSDYINANFVMGYKERKKFICAQGMMRNIGQSLMIEIFVHLLCLNNIVISVLCQMSSCSVYVMNVFVTKSADGTTLPDPVVCSSVGHTSLL